MIIIKTWNCGLFLGTSIMVKFLKNDGTTAWFSEVLKRSVRT